MSGDEAYREGVRTISDRIVETQNEIRVLNSVKWDDEVREAFFAAGCKEQPRVDRAYYEERPLGFDPDDLRGRFRDIESEIATTLGPVSPAGTLMRFMCDQFRLVVDLLEARGTPSFAKLSAVLYGTPDDVFHVGGPTVRDLSAILRKTFVAVEGSMAIEEEERTIVGADAVRMLQQRLDTVMGEGFVDVRLDDGIAADAAAGSSYIKIRADALFSTRDLSLLEAHEGWVHVGTTQNGLRQPVCTFLGKAAPRTTVTQEGLAVLTEVLNMRSHPRRLQRIMNRIDAIGMASSGATFVEVFDGLRDDGLDEDDAWQSTSRVFRGSTPTEGPFTKDLGYGKGLVLTYVYVRLAIRAGRLEHIPMLFCGKVDLQDLPALHRLYEEGLVSAPAFVPPPFDDLAALASTLAFSRFQAELDFDRLASDYAGII